MPCISLGPLCNQGSLTIIASLCFSASGLPTTGKFAGDLRYLFLSAFGTKQMLSRSFNSVDKLAELGLSYYGMVNAQVGLHAVHENFFQHTCVRCVLKTIFICYAASC